MAFSRILYGSEILVAYNVSNRSRNDCVIVDASFHPPGSTMAFLYGGSGSLPVKETPDGARFVQLDLAPYQFAILQ